ncbi:MAG: indolepyruvate oxidoreductase subunit beta [Chloroflexota bacterium]
MRKVDVLMAGVGGQGIILASDVLSEVAMLSGYDVKKSDALGMAQRGGAVVSHVRIGEKVFSPMIKHGDADIVLAFEKLEAARWSGYLSQRSTVILNNQAILPLSVSSGVESYPSDKQIVDILRSRTAHVFVVPGQTLAEELGNVRTLNMLMLGFLSVFLPMERRMWMECVSQYVPPNLLDLNRRAFSLGRERAREMGAESVASSMASS